MLTNEEIYLSFHRDNRKAERDISCRQIFLRFSQTCPFVINVVLQTTNWKFDNCKKKKFLRLCHSQFRKIRARQTTRVIGQFNEPFSRFTPRARRNMLGHRISQRGFLRDEMFADKYWIKFVIEIGGDAISDVVIDASRGRRPHF